VSLLSVVSRFLQGGIGNLGLLVESNMDNGAREILQPKGSVAISLFLFYGEHESTSQTTQLRLENLLNISTFSGH
jgi:hypothetical protein